ncbi:alpha/beta hydrolase [Actinomadura sp. WMMA1423]|uniref:alpha/beta hydrolase n=1 Tax=Actinomadura sp. WMMA1423 TaxID=2591108 RepID=UPI00197AC105|nr:alpha/beta hydrolase [Actinomadura sp. WMMA1423]
MKAHFEALGREMSPGMSLARWRDVVEHYGDVTAEPGAVDYLETQAAGLPALWAVPKDCSPDRVLLCLHGGGFATCSRYTHRKMFAHLAKAMGVRALIPEYRRAPEHPHPAQVDDSVAVYGWLLDQGFAAGRIAFAGDSAGGGLAVTALLRARARGLPLPAASMPLSPWVDMEAKGRSMVTNRDRDALLGDPQMTRLLIGMFLGEDGDPRDPYANPLYADLTGLPPLYIQAGGEETLLDDARRLAERARAAGVEARLDVVGGRQHTFQLGAGRAARADEAIRRLADWARPKVGLEADANAASGAVASS